jgi:hypothetical protein
MKWSCSRCEHFRSEGNGSGYCVCHKETTYADEFCAFFENDELAEELK